MHRVHPGPVVATGEDPEEHFPVCGQDAVLGRWKTKFIMAKRVYCEARRLLGLFDEYVK